MDSLREAFLERENERLREEVIALRGAVVREAFFVTDHISGWSSVNLTFSLHAALCERLVANQERIRQAVEDRPILVTKEARHG